MAVSIKNATEMEKMRCRALAAEVLEMIEPLVQPGITTGELDRICHDYITKPSRRPRPLNYNGFPRPSAPRSTTWSATAFLRHRASSKTAISSTST